MRLLKFGAVWCSPCKAMDVLLDEITQIPVERYDIEVDGALALVYNIRSVPTLILEDDTGVIAIRTGGINRQQLQEFLRR